MMYAKAPELLHGRGWQRRCRLLEACGPLPLWRRRNDAIRDADHDRLPRQQAGVRGRLAGHGDVREAQVAQQCPPAVPCSAIEGVQLACSTTTHTMAVQKHGLFGTRVTAGPSQAAQWYLPHAPAAAPHRAVQELERSHYLMTTWK